MVLNVNVLLAFSMEFSRIWRSSSLGDDKSMSFESAFRKDSSHKLLQIRK